MSLALEIANRSKKATKAKPATPSITLDDSTVIHVGGTEAREMAIAEASKIFVDCDARIKELETRKRSLSEALKAAGVAALRAAEEEGQYFVKALAGLATIVRQNKYKAIDIATREELVSALGAVEYSTLMTEKASIEFDSIEQLRSFVAQCRTNGVHVVGQICESVTPRSTFAETRCQILPTLAQDKRVVLNRIGEDTTFAVSARKVESDE